MKYLIPIFVFFALFAATCGNALACADCSGNVPARGLGVYSLETLERIRAESVTCKYCGRTAPNAKLLTAMGACANSPSGKHVVLRQPKTLPRRYAVCRYCGARAQTVALLTAGHCNANPRGKKHVPAN